jgi:hypothetical protein
MQFDVNTFDVKKFDNILAKGLSNGLGTRGEQVCIEAAICQVLDLPHGDDPGCVDDAVRSFKIALNDGPWSSPLARAKGLRELGLAQLGSKDSIDSGIFTKLLAEQTIKKIIPKLFREIFTNNALLLAIADKCEAEGTSAAAEAAAAWAAKAAGAAGEAAEAAAWAAAWAAKAAGAEAEAAAAEAAWAAKAAGAAKAAAGDQYLILSAQIALDILKELKSPGVSLLDMESST